MCRPHKAFEPGRRLASPKYERNGTENQPEVLREFFKEHGLLLVDFKLEFGILPDGSLAVIDEISPDTCRLWDAKTGEKLDKDRFRFDLGDLMEGYRRVLEKIQGG
jgi:phosphoribosylaminoimidazole-succinocarboxamide synthase